MRKQANKTLIVISKTLTISLIVCLLLSLSSCATVPQAKPQETKRTPTKIKPFTQEYDNWSKHDTQVIKDNQKNRPESTIHVDKESKKIDLKQRMLLQDISNAIPIDKVGNTFSFSAKHMELQDALHKFANKYHLQIIVGDKVEGTVFTHFKNQPLNKAIELILGPNKYYWRWDQGILKVSRMETKVFVLDYLRLVRSGIASNSTDRSDGSKSQQDTPNTSTIQQSDNVAFWDELQPQLRSFISDDGRLVINRLSGTIQITDVPERIAEVSSFLKSLESALHRQVVIDARIMEVSLRDDQALGIDWQKISVSKLFNGAINTISGNPINSFGMKANTVSIKSFEGLVSALEEQGKIHLLSQPRIRTMNNQPSLIKVGTDKTFFIKTTNQTISMNGINQQTVTEKPQVVTEGLVLSLTPQISQDRWVMLDISPVITRIVDTTVSTGGSTAPVLDVKQASTMVRARDGEMIVLGGLIQNDTVKTVRRVPFLSSIPLLGKLFVGHYTNKIKKELVIFLVPRIVI